jgi:hypothetical protein
MGALMEREQLAMNGRHHEIYLTAEIAQLAPQEIRNILRHPVGHYGANSECQERDSAQARDGDDSARCV